VDDVVIRTVSTRADLVSDGDARVEIALQPSVRDESLRVTLGGRDVTAEFGREDDGRYVGLLTGLSIGPNVVEAFAGAGHGPELPIVNHAWGGPLFAGPQVEPWACTTSANSLGTAVNPQCDAARPVFSYKYKDVLTGQLLDYDPHAPPPQITIAVATTDQ